MNKFSGMTIKQALNSQPILRTPELAELFGRTARTFKRWQDSNIYENPMPRPFSECRGAGNNYDSGQILDWYNGWPIRKKEALDS